MLLFAAADVGAGVPFTSDAAALAGWGGCARAVAGPEAATSRIGSFGGRPGLGRRFITAKPIKRLPFSFYWWRSCTLHPVSTCILRERHSALLITVPRPQTAPRGGPELFNSQYILMI